MTEGSPLNRANAELDWVLGMRYMLKTQLAALTGGTLGAFHPQVQQRIDSVSTMMDELEVFAKEVDPEVHLNDFFM